MFAFRGFKIIIMATNQVGEKDDSGDGRMLIISFISGSAKEANRIEIE